MSAAEVSLTEDTEEVVLENVSKSVKNRLNDRSQRLNIISKFQIEIH